MTNLITRLEELACGPIRKDPEPGLGGRVVAVNMEQAVQVIAADLKGLVPEKHPLKLMHLTAETEGIYNSQDEVGKTNYNNGWDDCIDQVVRGLTDYFGVALDKSTVPTEDKLNNGGPQHE